MTGTNVLAEDLKPGDQIHIAPHSVHGRAAGFLPDGKRAGTAVSDAQVDDIEFVNDDCDVSVGCHPCFLGAKPGEQWCTTYHRTDQVLVIGHAA